MAAGPLRHRIKLQMRSTAKDDFGQPSSEWLTLLETWADIEPISGAQLERAKSVYNETTHRISLRWHRLLTDIRQAGAYRIDYRGRLFDIGACMNVGERGREAQLLAKEGLNEG